MYAIVKTAGKQFRVAKDDVIVVDAHLGEPGDTIELGDVLMIGEDGKAPAVGAPVVDKAKVFAEVVEQGKGGKVLIFKKRRRQNYRRLKGHRQLITTLRVADISPTGAKPKAAGKAAPKQKEIKAEAAAAAEAPAKVPVKKAAPASAKDRKPAAKKAAPKKAAPASAKDKKPAAKKAAPKKTTAKKTDAADKE